MSFINPESLARISMTANTGAKTLTIGVKNPFRCWIPDTTNPGSYFEKLITAPGVINGNGHASENFNLGEAGQTLAVAWGNNYPLYWYWVWDNINDVLAWVCSRNPCLKSMPASANNIGTTAAAPATSAQGNVFMNGNFTKANFVSLPVYGPIGSMPVQRTANQQQLDIVALTAGQDGFGLFQEGVTFAMPAGQNTASKATEYLYSTAAKIPTYATHTYNWWQRRDGTIDISVLMSNATVDGAAGANALYIVTPLVTSASIVGQVCHNWANARIGAGAFVIAGVYIQGNGIVHPIVELVQNGATSMSYDNIAENEVGTNANNNFSWDIKGIRIW